jgi:hypothetical protein
VRVHVNAPLWRDDARSVVPMGGRWRTSYPIDLRCRAGRVTIVRRLRDMTGAKTDRVRAKSKVRAVLRYLLRYAVFLAVLLATLILLVRHSVVSVDLAVPIATGGVIACVGDFTYRRRSH